jgi:hypothetical protein
MWRLLADLVVVVHLAFVGFVVVGGALVLRWPKVAWFHLPSAIWGAWIELRGWICPLTPLENYFRTRSGEVGYQGAFVARYVLPVLYPSWLTRPSQLALGLFVVGLTVLFYAAAFFRRFSAARR